MIVKVKIEDAVQATVNDENVVNALTKPDSEKTEEEKKAFDDFKTNMETEVYHFEFLNNIKNIYSKLKG